MLGHGVSKPLTTYPLIKVEGPQGMGNRGSMRNNFSGDVGLGEDSSNRH